MQDNHLWKNIKRNDKQALKELHDRYFHQMCLYAFKNIDNCGLAEELVADCFIKIWENRKKIVINTSVKHYIFLMVRNSIIDYYRKKRILTDNLDEIPEPADEKFFDEQQQYARLYQALQKLPDQRRKILEMAVFENMTYQQIAEKLDISKNTVKTQMGRAYRFLKETLDPKDFLLWFVCRVSE